MNKKLSHSDPRPARPQRGRADVHLVGRYALGVDWADDHGSIYPFEHLRRACPCGACADVATPGTPATWPQEIKKHDGSAARGVGRHARERATLHRAARPLPLRRLHGRSLMDERAKRRRCWA